MKFLVVDDSRIMRTIIKNSLDKGKLVLSEEIEFAEAEWLGSSPGPGIDFSRFYLTRLEYAFT